MVPISFLYPAYMLFVFFVGKSYVAFPHLAGTDLAVHGCRSIELINVKPILPCLVDIPNPWNKL